MSIIKKILLPLTIALIITAIVVSAEMDGKNEGGEMAAMADAIKYLQSLDKVYGQAARPRFGKRTSGHRAAAPQDLQDWDF